MLAETVRAAVSDQIMERGAALSYYVILSVGPLLVLLVPPLQLVLAEGATQEAIVDGLARLLGPGVAETVETVLANAEPPDLWDPTAIFAVFALIFGATAAFANVEGALNAIWKVPPRAEGFGRQVKGFFRTRLKAFLMIGLTGLLVTVSLVVTSVTTVLAALLRDTIPFALHLVQMLDVAVSVLVLGLLFAALFRTLPSVDIGWSNVWVGAFVTALLFVAGKFLIAALIARAQWTTYYGPGASVVVLLAWIYFSAQLFYLGAEFTQVWARRRDGTSTAAPR